jgi:hypothetical protein
LKSHIKTAKMKLSLHEFSFVKATAPAENQRLIIDGTEKCFRGVTQTTGKAGSLANRRDFNFGTGYPYLLSGQENWMFYNTANGTSASVSVYSISETAKLNNLRPYYYFK